MAQYISALILVGMAKHKVLAYVTLAEGLANLILSVILVRRIGLVGVAWGTAIPHVINTAVIIPFFTLRAVKMSWRDYIVKGYVRPVLAAIPGATVCYAASVLVATSSWPVFVLEVLAVGVTSAVAGYFLCLEPALRLAIAKKLGRSQSASTEVGEPVEHEA
jgi:O-antigen/teichoic acid export membrane protein